MGAVELVPKENERNSWRHTKELGDTPKQLTSLIFVPYNSLGFVTGPTVVHNGMVITCANETLSNVC